MKESNQPRSARDIVYAIQQASECIRQDNALIDRLFEELQALVDGPKTEVANDTPDIVQKMAFAVAHIHTPVQHRDGKEPWCNVCSKTAYGRDPSVFPRVIHGCGQHNVVLRAGDTIAWCGNCGRDANGLIANKSMANLESYKNEHRPPAKDDRP